jgi:GH24 family phage-related lysozyme (muramidase)
MTTSNAGLDFIMRLHGVHHHAIRLGTTDLMIGCRHILKPSERKYHSICTAHKEIIWKNGLTDADVKLLLKDDLFPIEGDLREGVKPQLQQHECDALVAFVFSIGRLDWLNSLVRFYLNQQNRELALKNWGYWYDEKTGALRKAELRLFTLRRYT